jgi:hypothetical protein
MSKTKRSTNRVIDSFEREELFEIMQECKLRLDAKHGAEQHRILLSEYADAVAAFNKSNHKSNR